MTDQTVAKFQPANGSREHFEIAAYAHAAEVARQLKLHNFHGADIHAAAAARCLASAEVAEPHLILTAPAADIPIIYPDRRLVSARQIAVWASDAVFNEDLGAMPQTIEDAALLLHDLGHITLKQGWERDLETVYAAKGV